MVFAIIQMPLVKRHHLDPVSLQASDAAEGDIRNKAN
jgi:intracellular septation protein